MFSVDPNITDLRIRERNLFKVLFSMNIHQVATPDLSVEDARSYVFFLRDGGKVQAYVGLYFTRTDRTLYYTHSSNPFPEAQLTEIEVEARGFAEDLGAMLDEIDFAGLSMEERNRWIDDQEILSGRKEAEKPKEPDQPRPPSQAAEVQTIPAEQSASAAQAGPAKSAAVQSSPVVQAPSSDSQSKPAGSQPQVQTSPVPSSPGDMTVQSGPAPQAVQPPRPQRRAAPAPPHAAARPNAAVSVPETDEPAPAQGVDDVLEQAVKAGVVKAPKAQLKKDIRGASGVVSREKEALARLLASF